MRTPIVVLIFGAPKIGKSNIANQLADKMNISNVLQTDIISSVMEMMNVVDKDLHSWKDTDMDVTEMIKMYNKKCYQTRKGANTDIQKCLAQGKPVIIEGNDLHPKYFLRQKLRTGEDSQEVQAAQLEMSGQIKAKLQQYIDGSIHERDILDDYSIKQDPSDIELFQPDPEEWETAADRQRIECAKEYYRKFDQTQLVIVAFHLVISKKQHRFNIHSSQQIQKISDKAERERQTDAILTRYQAIQNHLLEYCTISCTIPIDINCQQHTLDTLQNILLKKIENWYIHSSASKS